MIKLGLSIILFLIIPYLLGSLITHFMKKDNENILLSWLIGFFVQFTITEITTIIFTFLGKSFNSLFFTWCGISVFISIISVIINFNNFLQIPNIIKRGKKNETKILGIVSLLLIFIQCFFVFSFMHIDSDDSNFVAKASISIDTNTLYVYNDDGLKYDNFPARYVLSPFPVYIALISKFTGFHPMIMAHTILPVILTLLIYTNYYILAQKLFNNDKKKSLLFLIFINIIYIFGNFSTRSNFTFMLIRLWQGKAVLGNLILPSIITFYLMYIKEKDKFSYWIALLLGMVASCLVSTMGLALAPILLVSLTISYSISRLDLKNFKQSINSIFKLGVKSAICCFPNILLAVAYIILKGDAN